MKKLFSVFLVLLLCSCSINAAEKWLQNDGFFSGGTAYYQQGFVSNEIMASVFAPDPGDYPCQLKKVHTLVQDGGAGGTIGLFVLTIWEDNGSLNPGTVLFAEAYQLTAANAFNEIDLTAENIIVTSGNIRVGYEFIQDPPPSFCRDGDGNIQTHVNLIFAQGVGWQWSETFGLQGDWIHRLQIDTNVSTVTATPTAEPPTATPTATPTTGQPTETPTQSLTQTPTFTPTQGPTNTPIPTNTPEPTSTPTDVPTPTMTSTPAPPTPTPYDSVVYFDQDEYFGDSAEAIITVEDYDLDQDPLVQESINVKVWSQDTDPYPNGLTVTLYEDGPSSDRFQSIFPHVRFGTESRPGDNILGVEDGETIHVRYLDVTTTDERLDSAVWRSTTLHIEFLMPDTHFGDGDIFNCDLVFNNGGEAIQVDLYVLLDIYGEFFVYPTWQSIYDGLPFDTTLIPGHEQGYFTIFEPFTMPAVSAAGPFFFYGAMFDTGQLTVESLVSDVAIAEFYLE